MATVTAAFGRLLPSAQTTANLCNCAPFSSPPETNPVDDGVWMQLREEAEMDTGKEPMLRELYTATVLSHCSLEKSLAFILDAKLSSPQLRLKDVFIAAFDADPGIGRSVRKDLAAFLESDPACSRMVHCFLCYKGFLAVQTHRVAHKLWEDGRRTLALFLQSRVSEVFAVDIHPAAVIGSGLVLDHATGVVIGETSVVGDNVSIFHNVTLGGTGKITGDRHPKIGDGVLIGTGTNILGNVRVGRNTMIGAGTIVRKNVPEGITAVGNPARFIVDKKVTDEPNWAR